MNPALEGKIEVGADVEHALMNEGVNVHRTRIVRGYFELDQLEFIEKGPVGDKVCHRFA